MGNIAISKVLPNLRKIGRTCLFFLIQQNFINFYIFILNAYYILTYYLYETNVFPVQTVVIKSKCVRDRGEFRLYLQIRLSAKFNTSQ